MINNMDKAHTQLSLIQRILDKIIDTLRSKIDKPSEDEKPTPEFYLVVFSQLLGIQQLLWGVMGDVEDAKYEAQETLKKANDNAHEIASLKREIERLRQEKKDLQGAVREHLGLSKVSDKAKFIAAFGQKILSIKVIREETGLGLADAKDAVEKFLESGVEFATYKQRASDWLRERFHPAEVPASKMSLAEIEGLSEEWGKFMSRMAHEKAAAPPETDPHIN